MFLCRDIPAIVPTLTGELRDPVGPGRVMYYTDSDVTVKQSIRLVY